MEIFCWAANFISSILICLVSVVLIGVVLELLFLTYALIRDTIKGLL